MRPNSVASKILRWFVAHPGIHNAITVGELGDAIGVYRGTAVYQRMKCDVIIRHDVPIRKLVDPEGHHRYFLSYSHLSAVRERFSAILATETP